MRIGISTSVIQRGKTGVGQYVLSLVKAILDEPRSHDFVLFVLERDLDLFEFARDEAQIVIVPERFRPPLMDISWHQAVLPNLACNLNLNVLHVPSYRRMIWRRPCKLVATIHDLAPFHIPNKYDWARMFYVRNCARRLIRRQDRVITISQTTARDIRRFFGRRLPPIDLIHNGLDHARFSEVDRGAARKQVAEHFGLNHPYFVYVSRLEHPAKNHLRLLEAFNQFKAEFQSRWQLVFAGGDWHGARQVYAGISDSPFAKDIRCFGFVAAKDLPTLYAAAGACVYPSLYEGFGLPPLEAMASGCPVISSTGGSLGEVVSEAAIRLRPDDVEGWKLALARVSTDEHLREQLREAGFERARKFDWKETAAATLDVYERLCEPNGARGRGSSCRHNSPAAIRTVQSV